MLVRDCMTRNPITVRPHSDPLAAIALLKSARVRRLPVVDEEGRVVGMVTQTDLERFLSNGQGAQRDCGGRRQSAFGGSSQPYADRFCVCHPVGSNCGS